MNTKLLMTASAVFMGLIGIALTFLPDEVLKILEQVAQCYADPKFTTYRSFVFRFCDYELDG